MTAQQEQTLFKSPLSDRYERALDQEATLDLYLPLLTFADLQVYGAVTPELSTSLFTGVVFRIVGGRWAPHSLVDVVFRSVVGFVVQDQANFGPTLRANSIGSLDGYWGGHVSGILGPEVEEQRVSASGGGRIGGCLIQWVGK